MPTPKETAAVREIMTAIVQGTSKIKSGKRFFNELHRQLKGYSKADHADFIAWLKGVGIRRMPTVKQCQVACELANTLKLKDLSPHAVLHTRDAY